MDTLLRIWFLFVRAKESMTVNSVNEGSARNFSFNRSLWFFVGVFLLTPASGQSPGTTVQLPTFSNFSYSGSVLVPDSGGAHLGGNGRGTYRSSRSRTGLPNINDSSLQSLSDAQARAYIIDHDQWDRMVLGGSPEEFLRRHRDEAERIRSDSLNVDSYGTRSLGSRSTAARVSTSDGIKLGKMLVRLGRRAAQQGDLDKTRYYYEYAQEHLDERLGRLANEELQKQLERLGSSVK